MLRHTERECIYGKMHHACKIISTGAKTVYFCTHMVAYSIAFATVLNGVHEAQCENKSHKSAMRIIIFDLSEVQNNVFIEIRNAS